MEFRAIKEMFQRDCLDTNGRVDASIPRILKASVFALVRSLERINETQDQILREAIIANERNAHGG